MLFGHQNNEVTQPASDLTPAIEISPSLNPLAVDPTTGVSLPVIPDGDAPVADSTNQQGVLEQSVEPDLTGLPLPPPPTPVAPPPVPTTAPVPESLDTSPEIQSVSIPAPAALDEPTTEAVIEPIPEPQIAPDPVPEPAQPEEPVMPFDTVPAPAEPEAAPAAPQEIPDDLIDLKQQALAQLTPLVDMLDQTPEEEFRTKMMMIQSTDDQSLIKEAYEAALAITDEKSRAQALLDIINEINYFTTPHTDQ